MHWKQKALFQRLIARLPERISQTCYYALQKVSGSFHSPQVGLFLQAAEGFRAYIERSGGRVQGASFLEVGSGRRLTLPVILWLMGAEKVVTVDLHRYLRQSVLSLDLRALCAELESPLFCRDHGFLPDRIQALRTSSVELQALERLCSISYLAPADAAQLCIPPNSIDYHISYTVFEHIPPTILKEILIEAVRVLRPAGLAIHLVDHSDHFSHTDSSISAINFLQYDDDEWERIADNVYMYMNRLRADDYQALYQSAGHQLNTMESTKDTLLLKHLSGPSFQLARRFRHKTTDTLITTTSWIVSRARVHGLVELEGTPRTTGINC